MRCERWRLTQLMTKPRGLAVILSSRELWYQVAPPRTTEGKKPRHRTHSIRRSWSPSRICKRKKMKEPGEIVLFFPDVDFILVGKRAELHVSLLSLCSFSLRSIENLSRTSGLFSTVGTFSLFHLSSGWIPVTCKLHRCCSSNQPDSCSVSATCFTTSRVEEQVI